MYKLNKKLLEAVCGGEVYNVDGLNVDVAAGGLATLEGATVQVDICATLGIIEIVSPDGFSILHRVELPANALDRCGFGEV